MKRSECFKVVCAIVMTIIFFYVLGSVTSNQIAYQKKIGEDYSYTCRLKVGDELQSEIDKHNYIGILDQWLIGKTKQEVLDFFSKDSLQYIHKIILTNPMKNNIVEWCSFGNECNPDWNEDSTMKPFYDWYMYIRCVCEVCDDVYVLNGMPYYFFFINDTLKLRLDTNPTTYNVRNVRSYIRHKDFEPHLEDYAKITN